MRIVVVGAGIAGLVAAGAAHRADHQVTVVERSAPGSAAVAGRNPDPSGRWLVRTTVGERGELGAGSEVAIVHRADLQRVLTDQPPRSCLLYTSDAADE